MLALDAEKVLTEANAAFGVYPIQSYNPPAVSSAETTASSRP